MKRFLLPLFLAACSSEAPAMSPEDSGVEADAAEHEGAAGEGAEDAGLSDANLVGFGDSGQDSGQDAAEPDPEVDAGPDAAVDLPVDLFVGTWDIEETQCWNLPNTSKDMFVIERLDPPHVGPNGTANYVLKPYAQALYREGDELVTRSGSSLRFWLIDQNTLGGMRDPACPEFVLTGVRVTP